ncbi:hypothetical protein ABT381_20555 [Streptomyces sp. NPDC000151]|uniref:hypothetical protein n=1 Tax=Streptomyces sp. NPDC000151 TaxID=3154244 RepID=UPI0033331EA1
MASKYASTVAAASRTVAGADVRGPSECCDGGAGAEEEAGAGGAEVRGGVVTVAVLVTVFEALPDE